LGVAPVPTTVSVILRPDGVVTVAPAAWANAVVGAPAAIAPVNAATKLSAAIVPARGKTRILFLLLHIDCV
jgi:hypothetical protein